MRRYKIKDVVVLTSGEWLGHSAIINGYGESKEKHVEAIARHAARVVATKREAESTVWFDAGLEPRGLSRSEALTVLHLAGLRALASWPERALANTKALVKQTGGLF